MKIGSLVLGAALLLLANPALAQQASTGPAQPTTGPAQPSTGSEPSRVLSGISGLDFSKLPTSSQKELATVFTDEFDWCGRPLTVAASLKSPNACKHTRRLAVLAASQAMDGMPATEIIVALSRYNQSFAARRQAFKPDERMCQGPKDAKVTVVEFADFECPHCAATRPILEQAIKGRKDVRLCFQPFPLQGHAMSVPAAQAVLFARDNGKFWQLHDALFENQLSLSDSMIKETAKKLGLDDKALAKAISSGKYLDELTASKELGRLAGVDATPSLYFNGRKLTLGIGAEAIAAAIEDELEWSESKNAWPSN